MAASNLTADERYSLLRSVGEECIQENELRNLVEKKPGIRCYDGFEPSGRMHIAQGIFKAVNVNKCTKADCVFVFWVADWFALMNDKVGGEMEKIRTVGRYLIEVWKAAGMDMTKVVFLWSSDEITQHADTYWRTVLDIGRRNTIARIKKCCTIMGKTEGGLTCAQVLYPMMQCSDIFFLKADICQLGLDQRKVNMLAREYCDFIGRKLKPVILSHHMLAGLKKGQAKMSKSDPDSAIFMEDSAEDVARKIRQAYCPRAAQAANAFTEDGAMVITDDKNPVLDYYQCVVYARPGAFSTINGKEYPTYESLENAFINDEVSEEQLKESLIAEINALLEPVRNHFATNAEAHELLEMVKSFRKGGAAPPPAAIPLPELSSTPLACIWLPAVVKLPLDTAVAIISSAKRFLAEHENGSVVLLLPEWTAFASDEITGDEKDITAALQFNLKLLEAYGLPSSVRAVRESELILAGSNEFWTTTINVGRKNSLTHVEELTGELKNSGQVISALMRVSGALMLKVNHVIGTSYDGKLNQLISEYSQGAITCLAADESRIVPLHRPDAPPAILSADDVLYLDDNDMDIRRKIKKAYSAPEEDSNPVISLAVYLMSVKGEVAIERGEANGGNVTFKSEEDLRKACLSGALHPADLKSAVTNQLMELSAATRAALGNPDVKKLSQTLRNAEKKLAKKK